MPPLLNFQPCMCTNAEKFQMEMLLKTLLKFKPVRQPNTMILQDREDVFVCNVSVPFLRLS